MSKSPNVFLQRLPSLRESSVASLTSEVMRCDQRPGVISAVPNSATDCGGDPVGKIVLGVCCMAKKLMSDTMQAMLARFREFQLFEIVAFEERVILHDPVDSWPVVDVMISFFSSGFPLNKAILYAVRHPHTFFVTHPASQKVLLDRRGFYSALTRNNVPVPHHIFCSRDGYLGQQMPDELVEDIEHEWISVNDRRIYKPFVEKPVDSEDHNVYIYFDKSRGGGCRKLFRKKDDQSSLFDPNCVHVRRNGSFVYEEFVETLDLMDVKCYTVGPNFVHAEQRKAPTVDGVVLRSPDGKELREETRLTPAEMMVARKVIKIFRQYVCGFDLLRVKGSDRFFVCDVNGWSFVKKNPAYVRSATAIMKDLFVEEVRKRGLHRVCTRHCGPGPVTSSSYLQLSPDRLRLPRSSVDSITSLASSAEPSGSGGGNSSFLSAAAVAPSTTPVGTMTRDRHLVGIVGVLRHADRTPKQKVKIVISTDVILELVFDGQQSMQEELVFKGAHPMIERIRSCTKELLEQIDLSEETSSQSSTEVVGTIVQRNSGHEVKFCAHTADEQKNSNGRVVDQLRLMHDVMTRAREGLKVQIRPVSWDPETGKCVEALLICKWGGWLTDAGHKQAEMLGNHFIRRIFGAEPSEHCISPAQLSVETNNERRVIHTGLDFARCLLKDSSLTESFCLINEPLLGHTTKCAKQFLSSVATRVQELLHAVEPSDVERATSFVGVSEILKCPVLEDHCRTPLGALQKVYDLMQELVDHIPRDSQADDITLYRDEPLALMRQRWYALAKAFYNPKTGMFDTTKITDIFDYVSYDVCYNQASLAPLDMYPLFTLCEALSAFVSNAEYGLRPKERRVSAALIGTSLLQRILSDLMSIAADNCPRTRLYFTSESHVMSLKNALYYGIPNGEIPPFHYLGEPMELHFLTHFVFKLYRYDAPYSAAHASPVANQIDAMYQLEVHFSSGIDKNMFGIVQEHHVEYSAVTPMIRIHNDLSLGEFQKLVAAIEECREDYIQNPWDSEPLTDTPPFSRDMTPRCGIRDDDD